MNVDIEEYQIPPSLPPQSNSSTYLYRKTAEFRCQNFPQPALLALAVILDPSKASGETHVYIWKPRFEA